MNARVEKVLKLPFYQRLLLLGALLAVIVGLFVYLAYLPALEEHTRLVQQNDTLTAKLQQDQRIANNLPKFKAEYEKMQKRLDEALMELPNEKEIPTLLTNIGSLAKESGLEVQLFKPQTEAARGFYAEVPVNLKLTGNYHEMAMFAYQVGKLSRIVNLGNLKLKAQKSEPGRALLGIECTAVTFRFLPQDKEKK